MLEGLDGFMPEEIAYDWHLTDMDFLDLLVVPLERDLDLYWVLEVLRAKIFFELFWRDWFVGEMAISEGIVLVLEMNEPCLPLLLLPEP